MKQLAAIALIFIYTLSSGFSMYLSFCGCMDQVSVTTSDEHHCEVDTKRTCCEIELEEDACCSHAVEIEIENDVCCKQLLITYDTEDHFTTSFLWRSDRVTEIELQIEPVVKDETQSYLRNFHNNTGPPIYTRPFDFLISCHQLKIPSC